MLTFTLLSYKIRTCNSVKNRVHPTIQAHLTYCKTKYLHKIIILNMQYSTTLVITTSHISSLPTSSYNPSFNPLI